MRLRNSFPHIDRSPDEGGLFASVQTIKCVSAEQAIALSAGVARAAEDTETKGAHAVAAGRAYFVRERRVLVCRPAWDQFARH